MVAPGEEMRTTTVLVPSPTLRLLSQEHGASNGRTLGKQNLFKQDVKQATGKVKHSESKQHVFTHGLHRLQHFSCDSPVRFMMYSEAAAAFISLHSDNTVCLYKADGNKQTSLAQLPFMGLTATKIPGSLVGWGPGPVFTLLDSELRSMDAAHDALDIRVCQAAEHSTELVTAGEGNVCVWSVMLMRCKVKIQEELQHSTFTQMALAPPRSDRPHRAFVVCGQVVTLVDLDAGKVLEHKRDLCSRDITAMVYCSQLDCLITASQELSIRIWGPDWELRVAFVGHNGMVNSLYYCSALGMLLSASVDCTIRCWNVEKGDVVECVHTEQKNPALCIGGTKKGDTFFSFSQQGVDVWTFRTLYTLHCKLKGDEGAPLRQILASPFPAPYPTRVLCVSGYSDIMLVAAETGAVLTSFKAEQTILCADYCLQKEILLALTDTGTVLQANTLTNPITLMKEWKRRGQGPWKNTDHVTEDDAQNLPIPGPAFCLILYSYLAETQGALEEWRSLQERRGCSHRNEAALDDAKNRFLIILGQSGGCVSVLKIDNGKVLQRMPAHNGQRVTALQVYPENGYLLSTGEDMTVVVWKVNPYVQECLTQQLSLHCGQSPVYLAALGPKLALTFQEPNSGTYNLRHFNLLNQSQKCPPKEGHSDPFTGLCVCPDLEVFVSSSLDGLVCIWNEENHLIRMLQLNAVPECLAYSGFGGELFLGIGGDLYRMNCAKFLPHNFQQMLLYTYCAEPLPDMPIIENQENSRKIKNASTDKDEEKELPSITSNLLLTEDKWRQKEYVSSVTSNMDLAALLRGSVKCRKGKPPSTTATKKEAFDRYMKIIYGLPPNIKVDLGDTFDPDKLEIPYDDKPCNLPTLQKKVHIDAKLKIPEEKAPTKSSKPKTPKKVKPRPVDKVLPKKPVIVEKYEEPPEIISPIEQPKPPPPRPKTTTPPPPPPRPQPPPSPPPCPPPPPRPPPTREPTPEVPTFLQQFANAGWFKDLYPDQKCIPSTLSPEDFSLQLLGRLNNCSATSKIEILVALQELRSQGLLQNTDEFYQGLIDLVPGFVRPHMSPAQRVVLVETLNLLVRLRSARYELVKKLLTLLAFKKLGLRETLLRMLTALAVNEAEQWLLPELESWDSELQDPSDIWKSLHDKADSWLELWISKYKEHNRLLYLRSTAKWKPSTFSMVDVLNYFCCVQKEEYRKARYVAPTGPKRTVLLPLYDCSSKPILRLGETYSMARIWRPPGLILPPLRSRPFLMHFPNFISLPLSRVTLCPFHIYSDKDWVKASPRRYFIQQQSYVEYYR
ncbi:WD repeat-containing protein 97 isoform X3 [Sander lucioperca]|uniref:WD repeat-containing protein 97 isoform X3 n=1 Tax=Sander lucioperca TaxID=283035 RepID=UPI00125CD86B|nr:WD repeat-containing protein 97 isoform X3 [Sander lucioperca]